jgi:enoyl-CoA hydratase/carnithine racemase
MWQMAGEMLDDFRNDNNIKVVVVTGAGGKAFVSAPTSRASRRSVPTRRRSRIQCAVVDKSYAALPRIPKPTIAMIRGYCIGGGMGLATCCDIRIATEKSTFAVPAAKLGLGYAYPA